MLFNVVANCGNLQHPGQKPFSSPPLRIRIRSRSWPSWSTGTKRERTQTSDPRRQDRPTHRNLTRTGRSIDDGTGAVSTLSDLRFKPDSIRPPAPGCLYWRGHYLKFARMADVVFGLDAGSIKDRNLAAFETVRACPNLHITPVSVNAHSLGGMEESVFTCHFVPLIPLVELLLEAFYLCDLLLEPSIGSEKPILE